MTVLESGSAIPIITLSTSDAGITSFVIDTADTDESGTKYWTVKWEITG